MRTESTESNFVCFKGDTRVGLADGSSAMIANICVGESIFAYNQASDELVVVRVETIASSFHMCHVILSFEDGTILACTDDHPLWVDNKGWCVLEPGKALDNYGLATKHLSIGDKLLVLRNGLLRSVSLENIELVLRPSRMWVIGTGSNHTFFANGILAHDENVDSLDLTRANGVIVEKSISHPQEEPALV